VGAIASGMSCFNPSALGTCEVHSADTQSDLKRLATSCRIVWIGKTGTTKSSISNREFESDAYRELVTGLGEYYFKDNQT
jgi:hypothetical protein